VRITIHVLLAMVFAMALTAQQAPPSAPDEAKHAVIEAALTHDEIAVYREFLAVYSNGDSFSLNLGNRTMPLELTSGDRDCLKGLVLGDATRLTSGGRLLTPEVVNTGKVVLVDPERQAAAVKANDPGEKIRSGQSVGDSVKSAFESGLLEVSEIAFDRTHRFAVMRFSFFCGMLCGRGGTLVFERANGRWKASKRRCSLSIS
jgi:hypothetical protein